MTGVLSFAVTLALAFGSFLLIARSQTKYRLRTQHWKPSGLRIAGSALLGLALVISILLEGIGYGLLQWALTLTLSAAAVVTRLTLLRSQRQ